MACTNDLTPIIIAVAVQIPLVCAAIIGWIRYKSDSSHSRERQYKMVNQNEKLLYIIENGFHVAGPPGPAGAAAPGGQAAPPAPGGQAAPQTEEKP